MRIGQADTDERVALVAEIGNNHEGSVGLAEEMIGQAAEAGADAIKLQTFVPELFVSPLDPARLETMRRFALSHSETERLIRGAAEHGITVFSTPLDLDSLFVLAPLVSTIKVASGDITFSPLLEAVAATGKDTIISTGASTMDEVAQAVAILEANWSPADVHPDLAILHCVSSYPAAPSSANLRAIATLASAFPHATIGYSDHTLGVDVAVYAAAAGARIIEKHFTLNKAHSDFRDHALSADPVDFRALRDRIDLVQELLGNGTKGPDDTEDPMIHMIRRSLTVTRDVGAKHLLECSDLICMRPGTGMPPSALVEVIGRRLAVAKQAGEVLFPSDLA